MTELERTKRITYGYRIGQAPGGWYTECLKFIGNKMEIVKFHDPDFKELATGKGMLFLEQMTNP